jgi:hypothetical protein
MIAAVYGMYLDYAVEGGRNPTNVEKTLEAEAEILISPVVGDTHPRPPAARGCGRAPAKIWERFYIHRCL